MYLAADLEEPCYEGRHLWMVLLLGISQFLLFIVGLPALMFIFLHRNKHLGGGGLKKHATIVRYGYFYGAYKDNRYYWEFVLTGRKIAVVAMSVFGPGMGTERQAQMVLAVLLVCISLEIGGDPYKQVDIHGNEIRMLSRLELAALFVQWTTMWGGSMIFASQDRESEIFVQFLSVVLTMINITLVLWCIFHLLATCRRESAQEKARKLAEDLLNGNVNANPSQTFWDVFDDKKKWVTSRLMNEETRQARTRRRTTESSDPTNQPRENPLDNISVNIEMSDMNGEGGGVGGSGGGSTGIQRTELPASSSGSSSSGAVKIDDDKNTLPEGPAAGSSAVRLGGSGGGTSETLRRQRVKSLNSRKKGMTKKKPRIGGGVKKKMTKTKSSEYT